MLKPPEPPRGALSTQGRNAWRRMWQAPNVKEEDYDAILLAAKLTDERAEYETYFKSNPRHLWINNATNLVVHPYVKRLQEIDKLLESLYIQLGLTPMGRAKMRAEQTSEEDPVEALARKWLAEEPTVAPVEA